MLQIKVLSIGDDGRLNDPIEGEHGCAYFGSTKWICRFVSNLWR
jgi:hypothetical protein